MLSAYVNIALMLIKSLSNISKQLNHKKVIIGGYLVMYWILIIKYSNCRLSKPNILHNNVYL